jgi:hypothetical protein
MRATPLALLLLALAAPAAHAQQTPATADRLGWLAGCWVARSGARVVEEQWMRPRGGSLLGMSRTVAADSAVAHELMRIVDRGGGLVFQAHPSGQAPAEFPAVEAGPERAVFADPAHDFPQRIVYRRVGADSLVARVEGERDGTTRGFDFRYARVACP